MSTTARHLILRLYLLTYACLGPKENQELSLKNSKHGIDSFATKAAYIFVFLKKSCLF